MFDLERFFLVTIGARLCYVCFSFGGFRQLKRADNSAVKPLLESAYADVIGFEKVSPLRREKPKMKTLREFQKLLWDARALELDRLLAKNEQKVMSG